VKPRIGEFFNGSGVSLSLDLQGEGVTLASDGDEWVTLLLD